MDVTEAYDGIRAWFTRPDAVYGFELYPEEIESYTGSAGHCVYRAGKDPSSQVRCAVGCLIPDEVYRPEWDECGGSSFIDIDELARLLEMDQDAVRFLRNAQHEHDDCARDGAPMPVFIEALDKLYEGYVT